MDDKILKFDSDFDAKKYGQSNWRSKYEHKNVRVNDEDVILCTTNLAYEDEVWDAVSKIYDWLSGFLPESKRSDNNDYCDAKSDIRDYIISCFEEYEGVRFLCAFDEY